MLDDLASWPGRALLAPGATEARIAALNCGLPEDLLVLHREHDGLTGERAPQAELFPGGYWLSLAQAAEERAARLRASLWREAWWPAFVAFDGDAHVVVLDEPGAPVWHVSGHDPDKQAFASVGELFAVVTECWRTGIYTSTPMGVEVDEARYAALRGESPSLADPLRLALRRGHKLDRARAARRLGAVRDTAAAPALVAALADPAPEVRAQAIGALGALKYKPAIPALVAALSDPAPDVRRQAAGALARLGVDPGRSRS